MVTERQNEILNLGRRYLLPKIRDSRFKALQDVIQSKVTIRNDMAALESAKRLLEKPTLRVVECPAELVFNILSPELADR